MNSFGFRPFDYLSGHYRYQEGGSLGLDVNSSPDSIPKSVKNLSDVSGIPTNKPRTVFFKGIDDPQAVDFTVIESILRRLKYYVNQQIFNLTGELANQFRTYRQTVQLLRVTKGYGKLYNLAKTIFSGVDPIPGTIGFYVIGSGQFNDFIPGLFTKDNKSLPKRWTPWGCRNITAAAPGDYETPRNVSGHLKHQDSSNSSNSPIDPSKQPTSIDQTIVTQCPDYVFMLCSNKSTSIRSSGYICLDEELKPLYSDRMEGDYFVMLKNGKTSSFAYIYLVDTNQTNLSARLIDLLREYSIKDIIRYFCNSQGGIVQIDLQPVSLAKYFKESIPEEGSIEINSSKSLDQIPEQGSFQNKSSVGDNFNSVPTSSNDSSTVQLEQIQKKTSGGPGVNPSNSWGIFSWIILIAIGLLIFFFLWWLIYQRIYSPTNLSFTSSDKSPGESPTSSRLLINSSQIDSSENF